MNDRDNSLLAWEEVSTEHIVQDEWIDFRRSSYRFPDGSIHGPFYSYIRKDYVVIVASDEEGRYICVRQFRQGIGEVTTEFPAGGIERRDGREYDSRRGRPAQPAEEAGHDGQDESRTAEDDGSRTAEDALSAAKRELLEETGYEAEEWIPLLTIPSSATIAGNYAYLFEAKNCRRVAGQSLDETEYLQVEKYTAGEIENMIRDGKFQQAVHVAAWLLARRDV